MTSYTELEVVNLTAFTPQLSHQYDVIEASKQQ